MPAGRNVRRRPDDRLAYVFRVTLVFSLFSLFVRHMLLIFVDGCFFWL